MTGIWAMALHGDRLTSEELAGLIVDALLDAGIVNRDRFEQAVAISAEEIDARNAAVDY
jgi:hypothetical protein